MLHPIRCVICNIEFYVKKYRVKSAKCCSRSCLWHYTKSRREPKRLQKLKSKPASNSHELLMSCKFCSKEFHISPSRIGKKFFCSRLCYNKWQTKPIKKTYKKIYVNGKRVLEHRHVMQCKLNRPLTENEEVHHINGNSKDNRINNLIILNKLSHAKITHKESRYR